MYQDLIGKYGSSVLLLNSMASAYMQLGNFEAAEQSLLEALEKDSRSAETRINLVVCYQHMRSFEKSRNVLNQLRVNNPNHPWMKNLDEVEQNFIKLTNNNQK